MTNQNRKYVNNSEHASSSWEDILEKVKSEQLSSAEEGFDKKAWDVKIACSKKVLDIFENAGGKTNEQLFGELNTVIESLTSGLSKKEKKALKEIETLNFSIQKQRDAWDMEDALKNNDEDDDLEKIYEDQDKFQKEMDTLDSMESQISTLEQSNGKVELITHLKNRLPSFAAKMVTIEDFKEYGLVSENVPVRLKKVIQNTRHKILYSNFGIHFLIRDKDWPEELDDCDGISYTDSPFTINMKVSGKKKIARDVLEHEGRHNIFNTLIDQGTRDLSTHLQSLDSSIQTHDGLTLVHAPDIFIGNAKKSIISRVSNMANIHINENRDEILANFEGLSEGKSSTDVDKYHKDRKILQKLRNRYEKEGNSLEIIDMAIAIFEDEMKQFYQKMSEYLFIASRTGNLQKIRLLVYWIDLEKYNTIESYLRSEVGNDIYDAYAAMRNIVDPLGIESLVTGEKLQKNLKPEEMLFRLMFGSGKIPENKFFKKAILRENIPSLLLYLKKYRTLDPDKQFRNNEHLRGFIGFISVRLLKMGRVSSSSSEDPQKIEQEQYHKDLVSLRNALKIYRQEPRTKKPQ